MKFDDNSIKALQGAATLIATAFPAIAPGVILGTSLFNLLRQSGLSHEDFATAVAAITDKLEESEARRKASLKSLQDALKDVDSLLARE